MNELMSGPGPMERKPVLDAGSTSHAGPVLSLVLCSRNDSYMGNSRWRLETSLNYVARKVAELGREGDVEVVVSDWGSDAPLREVLALSPAAAKMVSFVHVPSDLAKSLQQDSPFPEVLALNAAARRARGAYIGRIDQDTLVGRRFLAFFFELHNGTRRLGVPVEKALLFSNQRMVPYAFTSRSPSLSIVEQFIRWCGPLLVMEYRNPRAVYFSSGVGIWLVHRDLWHECGGYDERMIYMNKMETNMVRRLLMKYELVNLGTLVNYDFYHLEHYHPQLVRKSSTHRRVNPNSFAQPTEFRHNDDQWGLALYPLKVLPSAGVEPIARDTGRDGTLLFARIMFGVGPRVCRDLFVRRWEIVRAAVRAWRHRAATAWPAAHTVLSTAKKQVRSGLMRIRRFDDGR